jgi:hypothetical protein
MRDDLSLLFGSSFGLIFLAAGALLLNEAFSSVDPTQLASVISGAAFLSLGLASIYGALRNWWRSRKALERYRNG